MIAKNAWSNGGQLVAIGVKKITVFAEDAGSFDGRFAPIEVESIEVVAECSFPDRGLFSTGDSVRCVRLKQVECILFYGMIFARWCALSRVSGLVLCLMVRYVPIGTIY